MLQLRDEEEEDEEEVPQLFMEAVAKQQSSEFADARQSVENDPWDVDAWKMMLNEAKQNRSGTTTLTEVCDMILKQFPKSGQVWQLYCETLVNTGNDIKADDCYKRALRSCRHVGLWKSYLTVMKRKTVDRIPKTHENYPSERRNLENMFEQATENIGISIDSNLVWRMYIDFVKEWPEGSAVDAGKKLAALRKLYQKCITIPTDGIDDFWREYAELEKAVGEHLAEQLLAENADRYTSARDLYREKKRYHQRIDVNKFAIITTHPAAKTVQELDQLDAWSKYLR
jgi:cleavage stimulation factor subunit 3